MLKYAMTDERDKIHESYYINKNFLNHNVTFQNFFTYETLFKAQNLYSVHSADQF